MLANSAKSNNNQSINMKTKAQWEETEDLELNQYLQPLDEVDEDLYLYMAGVVHPQYVSPKFLQVGEADDKINGVYFFTTFMRINDKRYYLGSLPEFKK